MSNQAEGLPRRSLARRLYRCLFALRPTVGRNKREYSVSQMMMLFLGPALSIFCCRLQITPSRIGTVPSVATSVDDDMLNQKNVTKKVKSLQCFFREKSLGIPNMRLQRFFESNNMIKKEKRIQ